MKIDKEKFSIAMARACLTATDIQQIADMPRGTYIKAIAGYNIKPATAGRIAKALNVDVTEIIENEV